MGEKNPDLPPSFEGDNCGKRTMICMMRTMTSSSHARIKYHVGDLQNISVRGRGCKVGEKLCRHNVP